MNSTRAGFHCSTLRSCLCLLLLLEWASALALGTMPNITEASSMDSHGATISQTTQKHNNGHNMESRTAEALETMPNITEAPPINSQGPVISQTTQKPNSGHNMESRAAVALESMPNITEAPLMNSQEAAISQTTQMHNKDHNMESRATVTLETKPNITEAPLINSQVAAISQTTQTQNNRHNMATDSKPAAANDDSRLNPGKLVRKEDTEDEPGEKRPRPSNAQLPEPTTQEGGARGNCNNITEIQPSHDPSSRKDKNMGDSTTLSNRSGCELITSDDVYDKIKSMVDGGAKLVEYNIEFPEYNDTNPLLVDMGHYFRASQWSRAFTKHGRTLLSLSFNYKILSLTMLAFGVQSVDVQVHDSPSGCFGNLSADLKLKTIMEVIMSDFRSEIRDPQWIGDFDYACVEVITDRAGLAGFEYRCFERTFEGHRILVKKDESIGWIKVLFMMILLLKILLFLMGPMVLRSSFERMDYEIELRDPLLKTIVTTRRSIKSKEGQKDEITKFTKFKRKIAKFPEDEVKLVALRKLHIDVDHRRLMTEKAVPVGLFWFLYRNIVFCGLRKWEPFVSCCTESIFGSWSPKFLWLPLKHNANEKGKDFLKWKHVFKLLGGCILLVGIVAPYFLRLIIFNVFEKSEVYARRAAGEALGLGYAWTPPYTLIHCADPSHPAMIFLFCVYIITFIILAFIRTGNRSMYDAVAPCAIRDMRRINMTECFRLMVAHFTLPFEKFGVCGLLVSLIYWPFVMVFCLVVSFCYCMPTIYLSGRFLIHSRSRLLRKFPKPTDLGEDNDNNNGLQTLSKGASSFETALLLENISEGKKDVTEKTDLCSCRTEEDASRCVHFLIGWVCLIFMASVLILLADALGFAVEVFVFTLMGAIINASRASKFIMLFFWMLIYASSCFNNAYKKYVELNHHIFSVLKSKLDDRIKDITILAEDTQKNIAFKYFSINDLKEMQKMEQKAVVDHESEDDDDSYLYYNNTILDDVLTRRHLQLHWWTHNLVLFLDRYDVPHIPRELFFRICELEGEGYPGPVHRSLLVAFKQLSYLTLFLVFVIVTVMIFGEAYHISSTSQLMMTLAGGFLPFMVRTVIKPKQASLNLNSYAFEAKLQQIIYRYSEKWPVADITFEVEQEVMSKPTSTANIIISNQQKKEELISQPTNMPFIDGAEANDTSAIVISDFRDFGTQTGAFDLSTPLTESLSQFSDTTTQTPAQMRSDVAHFVVDLNKRKMYLKDEMPAQTAPIRRRSKAPLESVKNQLITRYNGKGSSMEKTPLQAPWSADNLDRPGHTEA